MTDAVTVARANGCVVPVIAWNAATATGIPYWAVCAFLEQESAGGHNVFGHDPGWFSGAGEVTAEKYAAYKAGRAQHNAQGVGPMQLTWPPYQDQADSLGGCWQPRFNVLTGCQILAGFIADGDTWHEAAHRWNGSETYAVQMDAKFTRWQALLKDATPPGGHMIGYDLVQYRGEFYSDGTPKLVTKRIAQVMAKLEVALGYGAGTLDLPQGCHHDGSLSGGTHTRADVFDLTYDNHDAKAQALIDLGVIAYVRDYNWDGHGGAAHVHCLIPDSEHLASQAAAQIPDWQAHRNGLANHAEYTGHPWQADVGTFEYDPNWTRDGGQGQQGQGGEGQGKFPLIRDLQISVGWANNRHRSDRAALAKWGKEHPDMKQVPAAIAELDQAIPHVKAAHDALTTITGV